MRIRKRFAHPPPPPESQPPPPPPPLSPLPPRAAPRFVLPDPRPKPGGDEETRPAAVVQEPANPRLGFLTSAQHKEDKIEEDEGYHTTSPRKESVNFAAELIAGMRYSAQISSSSTGGRGDGYTTFLPLKKRKGEFESRMGGGTSREGVVTNLSFREEMKSKTNKKCLLQNNYTKKVEYDEEGEKVNNGGSGGDSSSKKCKRGSVILEGSRCSRVNGRGWRCSQPTLVGYSLCEHHLGKGRLRSMNSARNRKMAAAKPSDGYHLPPQKMGARVVEEPAKDRAIAAVQKVQDVGKNMDSDEEEEERRMNQLLQKRMKLGVVKARSMSSLLGQMDDDNKDMALPNNGGDNLS